MKTQNYNLIEEDWIPVLMKDGSHRRVSLGEMFAHGDRIADLSMVAYERISVMRLLICIAMAALDEKDLADEPVWRTCREKIPSAVAAYFAKWHDRFNFYGPHAFMQPDGLSLLGKKAKTDKIVIAFSSGSNGTLFDHGAQSEGRITSHEDRVLAMLAYQNFSACGTSSQCCWNGVVTAKSVKAPPLRNDSMVHTFLIGLNIIETIWLNLLTSEMIASLPTNVRGRPLWECDNLDRQLIGEKNAVNSIMWRLVPLSRVMKFEVGSNSLLLGEGLKYRPLPESRVFEAAVKRNSKDNTLEYVSLADGNAATAVWRNLYAVLSLKDHSGSLVLTHLNSDSPDDFTIWSGGLWAKTNEDKNFAALEWRFTIPYSALSESVLSSYENGVRGANNWAKNNLYAAAKSYRESLKIDKKKSGVVFNQACQYFWDMLEKRHPLLVRIACEDGGMAEWERVVATMARKAFEMACPHRTGRQLLAYSKARKWLFGENRNKKGEQK